MRTKWLALVLLAGGTLCAQPRMRFGVGFGYAAPAPVVAYGAPCPGPGYSWVAGGWFFNGPRREWRAGYWSRPPVARYPRYELRYHGRDRGYYRGFRR